MNTRLIYAIFQVLVVFVRLQAGEISSSVAVIKIDKVCRVVDEIVG